jgi:hypothetical protein
VGKQSLPPDDESTYDAEPPENVAEGRGKLVPKGKTGY